MINAQFLGIILFCFLAGSPTWSETEPTGVSLVPRPKVYRETGPRAVLHENQAVIVIGAEATIPEKYAAERLQSLFMKRFKRKLLIRAETELDAGIQQVILLGRRTTNRWLDRLCLKHNLDLSQDSPGGDGFIIEILEDQGRQLVLIGGCNERGVIYGQETFFDLLHLDEGQVVFPVVTIRDWADIPWRGRLGSLSVHDPESLDACVRARINFIDIRNEQRNVLKGNETAGFKFDEKQVREIVKAAHLRGIFVYGTVNCVVDPKRHDLAINYFGQLLDAGVDGLWMSFDDAGVADNPKQLIHRLLDLARDHGITGRQIAITPPAGSYQEIATEFNRAALRIPGLADALWYFTRVPCRADAETAKSIGLQHPPAWWHNWPRAEGGFLHSAYGGTTLRVNGKPPYLDLPPLQLGWHKPDYEQLRDAPRNTEAVAMFGHWCAEYVAGVLGLWAWNPSGHDWPRTRRAVYSSVFGRGQAEAAEKFDDDLARLKSLFQLPERRIRLEVQSTYTWQWHLKRPEDRKDALQLIDEMARLVRQIQVRSPEETMIDAGRLKRLFLEPMVATVKVARAMAEMEYPEYWFADWEKEITGMLASGQTEAAAQALQQISPRILQQVDRVAEALRELEGVDEWAAAWRARMSRLDHGKDPSSSSEEKQTEEDQAVYPPTGF